MNARLIEGGVGGGLLRFPLNEQKKGLVVPGKFTAFTKSVATGQKFKEELTHIKELCKRTHNWK